MIRRASVIVLATGYVACATPPPASASVGSVACGVAGLFSGLVGKACNVATGSAGGIVKGVLGLGGGAGAAAGRAAGLAAVVAWVLGGARFALHATTKVIAATTSPRLTSTWFSSVYWRTAAIAVLLTLPFLFAAAVQSLMRSDLAMLTRAAFGYLPLAMLAVAIAAPLTMLLLAASDEMSSIVSAAAGGPSVVTHAIEISAVLAAFKGSPFLVFVVGLLAVAGALVLWLELVIREAAVYVIVLMLPLAFAAMVWPARRRWAIRGVEILVALILSKFAIVAVLTLGGAAMSHLANAGVAGALAGVALLMLGAFAPWALLKLLPLSEMAGAAMEPIGARAVGLARTGVGAVAPTAGAYVWDKDGSDWRQRVTAAMRGEASDAGAEARGTAGTHAGGTEPEPEPGEPAVASNGTSPADTRSGARPSRAAESAERPSRPPLGGIWLADDNEWPTLSFGGEQAREGWPDQRPTPPPAAEGTESGEVDP